MNRIAIAALAGALSLPLGFAAQTGTTAPDQGTAKTEKATKSTKKHRAKKHTSKKNADKTAEPAATPAPTK